MPERYEGKIKLVGKYRRPGGAWRIATIGFPLVGLLVAIKEIFYWSPFGLVLLPLGYLFLVLALFLPLVFLWLPLQKKLAANPRIPWYDIILAALSFGIPIWFLSHANTIIFKGWAANAPLYDYVLATILLFVVLEAARRAGGLFLLISVAVVAFYPLVASLSPIRLLWGTSMSFYQLILQQVFGKLGLFGVPMQTFGELLIGYLVFAVVIQATGAGQFFTDVALSLVGKTRGGAAKVAVIASALFGTISGSAVANVMTTGSFTIPFMKKNGLDSTYAGAVEATASAAGGITPPILGAVGFMMSEFLGLPYSQIAISAILPAALFYLGVIVQIDAHAAKAGLMKTTLDENIKPLPVWKAFLVNYHIVIGMGSLIFFLFALRMNEQAPWVAALVTLVLASIQKRSRLYPKDLVKLVESFGRTLCDLCAVMASCGLLIGALTLTGISIGFPHQIINLAGNNVAIVLIIGAIVNMILGLGLTTTAVYIFLAIVLAPALATLGLPILAVHLYILYIGEFSHTTPPVALAAFAAATIAEADYMKVSWQAMKLGMVKYVVPFLFVITPALILVGPLQGLLWTLPSTIIGIIILGGAFEGYFWFIGKISWIMRVLLIVAGVLLALPSGTFGIYINLLGLGIFAGLFILAQIMKRSKANLAKYIINS